MMVMLRAHSFDWQESKSHAYFVDQHWLITVGVDLGH